MKDNTRKKKQEKYRCRLAAGKQSRPAGEGLTRPTDRSARVCSVTGSRRGMLPGASALITRFQ